MYQLSLSRGFTLVEMMVTVSITIILLSVGVPMMRDLMESNTIASHVNSFVGASNLARSEAIKRGVPVVICRSDNPSADVPSCASSGTEWQSGWIVFTDRDADNQLDFGATGEVLLRVQDAITDTGGISQNTFSKLVFRPTGLLSSGASQFTFQSRSLNSTQQRRVCISLSGRIRLIRNSTDTCSD
jgi:type IV fimbrial biogenesis protein FimT